MAKGSNKHGIIVPKGASVGTVALEADFTRGVCSLTITRPFDVEPVRVDVPLLDVLEAAANMTITLCQLQRAAVTAAGRT
jgi:hypothetical protein